VVVVGVLASDQGQLSYINSYMVYLLVAHRVQRDESKDKHISKSYDYITIFAHFGWTASRPSLWWCWGVMAPDQGQPSYINSYVHSYLHSLVAHCAQRDYDS
jgi:hypothetical protein